MDFRLLEAYQILQDELCPQCGHPAWLCRSTSDGISWTMEKSICYATRAKEQKQWSKNNRGAPKKKDSQDWGVSYYMKPVVPGNKSEGTTLPTRKEFYSG